MIYYANPVTAGDDGWLVRDLMASRVIGCITQPDQGNVVFPEDWRVIADNGCFSDKWDDRRWWAWLTNLPRSIEWAVCPDVFDPDGGPCHDATLERWHHWSPRMRVAGFTPAFVCQVGATPDNVPDDAEVLFLGGTDDFKLGHGAERICMAHAGSRWIHMGRVNSGRRFRLARQMGCDSADGTCLTIDPTGNSERLLRWIAEGEQAPSFFEN